jgi:hypothetical protein
MSEFKGLRRHFLPTWARGARRMAPSSKSLLGPRKGAVRRATRQATVGRRTLASAITIVTGIYVKHKIYLEFLISAGWAIVAAPGERSDAVNDRVYKVRFDGTAICSDRLPVGVAERCAAT